MREDDPRQEHPELNISCPGLFPPSSPYKDVHCGQELEKAQTKRDGWRESEKEGGDILFGQLTECELENYKKKMRWMDDLSRE